MYNIKKDPITLRPQYVIAYTVKEGGTFSYLSCDGDIDKRLKFNELYARQDVHCLRVFGLMESHRREWIATWNEEHDV